jgi:hypothetical protein
MTIKDSLDTGGIVTTGARKGRISFMPMQGDRHSFACAPKIQLLLGSMSAGLRSRLESMEGVWPPTSVCLCMDRAQDAS